MTNKLKRVLVLSRYEKLGASSRYRFYQYLPFLKDKGYSFTVSPLFSNNYLKRLYSNKTGILFIIHIIISYLRRILIMTKLNYYNFIWLEKEALPWIPGFIEIELLKLSKNYIVDYDDAIFHNYDEHKLWIIRKTLGNKIKLIMQNATVVIVGNKYISQYAINAKSNKVHIQPTVVNLTNYPFKKFKYKIDNFIIGWIGSPSTSLHLNEINQVLKNFCKSTNSEVVAIGAKKEDLRGFDATILPWSKEIEATEIQNFDVGVMPLPNTPWEKGKCGLKLIQYMASRLPVIGTPVGINHDIIDHGVNGFQAITHDDWYLYLSLLKTNPSLRKSMGTAGRKMVERCYSLQNNLPKLNKIFTEICDK